MTREDSARKARRLLWEGRVAVHRVEPGRVVASVKGDSAAIYSVQLYAGVWSCSCPARSACSHARAVMLVTVPTPWAVQPELLALIGGQS
jgi:uncharacterized Zn finger protein